jgi:hypothetical protein
LFGPKTVYDPHLLADQLAMLDESTCIGHGGGGDWQMRCGAERTLEHRPAAQPGEVESNDF